MLAGTVIDSGSSELVDGTEDLKTGNRLGLLRGLALSIVEVRWDNDDHVRNPWTEAISVGVIALVLNLHNQLSMRAIALEWPMIHVTLNLIVGVITANGTFRVEDSVFEVAVGGVLGGVAKETLRVGERKI